MIQFEFLKLIRASYFVRKLQKLAAIMFAEIVGFTSFIQNDEALAMINLQRHNLFLGSLFPQFHGKEIRTIGDAFLVEFENVLDAVQCAIEIQTKLRKQNEGLFVSDED